MVEHAAVNRGVVGSSPTRGVLEVPAEAVASMRNDCKSSHIYLQEAFVKAAVSAMAAIEKMRLHGQAVKTSPFHGGNTGSIPVGVI